MRVLWVVMDALGVEKVTADLMPNLWRLSDSEGPGVGRGVLPSTTYPNHATFVTGMDPARHGIYANEVLVAGKWVGAGKIGPTGPTIFDHLGAIGHRTAAAFGDPELVGVCGATAAHAHWPPSGALPLDVGLGELLDLYGPHWDDTVVMVMSDHCSEEVGEEPGFDMEQLFRTTLAEVDPDARWCFEGTCAVIAPGHRSGVAATVADLECVVGVSGGPAEGLCVWGGDGVIMGLNWGQRGNHGSIRSRPQVAVLGGGHPLVPTIRAAGSRTERVSTDWFRMTMDLLAT